MKPEINLELFAAKISEKRGHMTLKDAANQIGKISGGTLARAENAQLPDLNTFIRICRWLDMPTDTFVIKRHRVRGVEDGWLTKDRFVQPDIPSEFKPGVLVCSDDTVNLLLTESKPIGEIQSPALFIFNEGLNKVKEQSVNKYNPDLVQKFVASADPANPDVLIITQPELFPSYETDLISEIEKEDEVTLDEQVEKMIAKNEKRIGHPISSFTMRITPDGETEEVPLSKAAENFKEKIEPFLNDLQRASEDEDLNQIIDMP